MYHKSLLPNDGMLFAYDDEQSVCFWMRNTYIPLSAAFIDARGIIIKIADMQPLDETNHCSEAPVKYVLEMNQGWFAANNIKIEDKVSFEN